MPAQQALRLLTLLQGKKQTGSCQGARVRKETIRVEVHILKQGQRQGHIKFQPLQSRRYETVLSEQVSSNAYSVDMSMRSPGSASTFQLPSPHHCFMVSCKLVWHTHPLGIASRSGRRRLGLVGAVGERCPAGRVLRRAFRPLRLLQRLLQWLQELRHWRCAVSLGNPYTLIGPGRCSNKQEMNRQKATYIERQQAETFVR